MRDNVTKAWCATGWCEMRRCTPILWNFVQNQWWLHLIEGWTFPISKFRNFKPSQFMVSKVILEISMKIECWTWLYDTETCGGYVLKLWHSGSWSEFLLDHHKCTQNAQTYESIVDLTFWVMSTWRFEWCRVMSTAIEKSDESCFELTFQVLAQVQPQALYFQIRIFIVTF